jgi:hypothetical protein
VLDVGVIQHHTHVICLFVIYLMRLSVSKTVKRRMVWWLVINELEEKWKEAVVAKLKYRPAIFQCYWRKTMKTLSQDSRCPDRDSKRTPPNTCQTIYRLGQLALSEYWNIGSYYGSQENLPLKFSASPIVSTATIKKQGTNHRSWRGQLSHQIICNS